jgi:hypothetical protein
MRFDLLRFVFSGASPHERAGTRCGSSAASRQKIAASRTGPLMGLRCLG